MNTVDFVTKTEFQAGMEKLVQHFDAKIDSKIDALAEAVAQGFVHLDEKKADKSDIVRLETKIGQLQTDMGRIEQEIRQGFEDSKNEMATFTSDVHDDLSWKINTLADFVGFVWPRRSR
jgi:hypothetical protein